MTESLHLTYDLKIRARKVYINKPLLMEMKMEKFKSEQKHHTVFSKQFHFKAKLYIPSTYYKLLTTIFPQKRYLIQRSHKL